MSLGLKNSELAWGCVTGCHGVMRGRKTEGLELFPLWGDRLEALAAAVSVGRLGGGNLRTFRAREVKNRSSQIGLSIPRGHLLILMGVASKISKNKFVFGRDALSRWGD